jgi:hypothetical protein
MIPLPAGFRGCSARRRVPNYFAANCNNLPQLAQLSTTFHRPRPQADARAPDRGVLPGAAAMKASTNVISDPNTLLNHVSQMLDQGQAQAALDVLDSCGQSTRTIQNAKGVCMRGKSFPHAKKLTVSSAEFAEKKEDGDYMDFRITWTQQQIDQSTLILYLLLSM